MKVEFRQSFVKDLRQIRDEALKARVKEATDLVERAGNLRDVQDAKRLRSAEQYFSIRVGDYRLGLLLDGDTVVFVRFLHRKDVYRYFP